jgi:hypothetical protein
MVYCGYSARASVLAADLNGLEWVDDVSAVVEPLMSGLALLERPFIPHVLSPNHPDTAACDAVSGIRCGWCAASGGARRRGPAHRWREDRAHTGVEPPACGPVGDHLRRRAPLPGAPESATGGVRDRFRPWGVVCPDTMPDRCLACLAGAQTFDAKRLEEPGRAGSPLNGSMSGLRCPAGSGRWRRR